MISSCRWMAPQAFGRCRTVAASLLVLTLATAAALACGGGKKHEDAATVASGSPSTVHAPTIAVSYATPGATTFRVLAGHPEGNRDVEAYMPADIRIRAGDTIEWTAWGFEGHTITFGQGDDVFAGIDYLVPNPQDQSERIFNPKLALRSEKQGTHDGTDEFINSGFIGVPAEQKYSLTFAKPGLFTYLCVVHPFTMTGTVSVEPAATQVESPATVAARGASDLTAHLAELEAEARRLNASARLAPGPADSTTHYVQVGAITDHGQVATYFPGALDVKAGDTVIFQNDDRDFHNVIFKGDRDLPPGVGLLFDPGGRGLNFSLSKASAVAVDPPAGGFDEKTFLSSGSLGVLQPRLYWTLRFTTPGTYVYACTIHVLAGMSGVINVR